MLACFGGWSLDAFDVQMYSFVIPTVIALWGLSTRRGRADRHRDLADLVVRRVVQRHARRPLRPGADAADHHPVVFDLHLPLRLRAEFRAALYPARAARFRLWRRMGRRRGADGRGDPRQVSRPRASGWCRPAGRSAGARRRWSTRRSTGSCPRRSPGACCSRIGLVPAVFVIWVRRHIDESEIFTRQRRDHAGGRLGASVLGVSRPAICGRRSRCR